jgi:hypothetical protein
MQKYEGEEEGGPQQQHPPRSARVLFQLYAQEEEGKRRRPPSHHLFFFFKREKVFPDFSIQFTRLFSFQSTARAHSLVVQITTTTATTDEMGCRP